MEIYRVFGWCLAAVAAATLIWPLDIPLMALAFRIHKGHEPLPFERRALWGRSALAATGLTALTLVAFAIEFAMVGQAEMSRGPVHLALLLAYVPAAVALLAWLFALDDPFGALSVFLIYIALVGLPLVLIGRWIGAWQALARVAPWAIFPP